MLRPLGGLLPVCLATYAYLATYAVIVYGSTVIAVIYVACVADVQ